MYSFVHICVDNYIEQKADLSSANLYIHVAHDLLRVYVYMYIYTYKYYICVEERKRERERE